MPLRRLLETTPDRYEGKGHEFRNGVGKTLKWLDPDEVGWPNSHIDPISESNSSCAILGKQDR